MADESALHNVAMKFDDWARTLTADEQTALAGWLSSLSNDEVWAHSRDWWLEPGAWSRALMSRELLLG